MALFAAAGIAVALLALAAGIYFASGDERPSPVAEAVPARPEAAALPPDPPVERARRAIDSALPSIDCTWLDVTELVESGGGVGVRLAGVADSPGRAQGAVSRALARRGISAKDINFEDVATIPGDACIALDAFRAIRKPNADGLAVKQRKWELERQESGRSEAEVLVDVNLGPSGQGFALFGAQETGAIEIVTGLDGAPVASRARMEAFIAGYQPPPTKLGDNRYRIPLYIDHKGWSGLLVLTGSEPFDVGLITTSPARLDQAWKQRFAVAAARGNWKSEMVWFRTVDEIPG